MLHSIWKIHLGKWLLHRYVWKPLPNNFEERHSRILTKATTTATTAQLAPSGLCLVLERHVPLNGNTPVFAERCRDATHSTPFIESWIIAEQIGHVHTCVQFTTSCDIDLITDYSRAVWVQVLPVDHPTFWKAQRTRKGNKWEKQRLEDLG